MLSVADAPAARRPSVAAGVRGACVRRGVRPAPEGLSDGRARRVQFFEPGGEGADDPQVSDPRVFHTKISGTRERYTVDELDGQLRGLILQHISDAIAQSGLPFLDLAANQMEFAAALQSSTLPEVVLHDSCE